MRLAIGTRIDDNLSGFFSIKRDKLFALNFDKIFWGYGDYFFRLLLQIQKAKFKLVEVPVFYGERIHGKVKTRFISVFMGYTKEVIKLMIKLLFRKW